MKKILILSLLIITGIASFGQQKTKVKHMTISVIDDHTAFTIGKKSKNMFITRDDTAQVQKLVDLNTHVKLRDQPAAYEQLLMNLLKPYYDDNWKLVTSTVEFNPNTNADIARYYFIKDE